MLAARVFHPVASDALPLGPDVDGALVLAPSGSLVAGVELRGPPGRTHRSARVRPFRAMGLGDVGAVLGLAFVKDKGPCDQAAILSPFGDCGVTQHVPGGLAPWLLATGPVDAPSCSSERSEFIYRRYRDHRRTHHMVDVQRPAVDREG